ncbi:RHS repeat-associated core domain-containing protein [Pseudomonas sp. 10-1B]|uniref:RHS repeat-associated core domain-containing protein n=1 Tax=Pseudomonas sp. 10-1B TaxID=1546029 RepID=UPI0009E655D9|nr:RHS repeat-associated core domain-containing protein [Pseudomonas sp. 10-1B]
MRMLMLSTCAYTPYGYAAAGKGRIGFNGEFRDPVSSCYPLGNGYRLYSPTQGRFCSPDNVSPFGRGGINAYAYCQGDPINRVDRDGHSIWEVLKGMGNTIKHIVSPGNVPYEQFSPIRKRVHEEVDTSTVYGRTVVVINKRMGANGDKNLPVWKGESYINRSQSHHHLGNGSPLTPDARPLRRSISESSMFFETVLEWYEVAKEAHHSGSNEQVGAAIVAIFANIAGGIAVSPHDHSRYKTGRILLYPGDEVPNIRK